MRLLLLTLLLSAASGVAQTRGFQAAPSDDPKPAESPAPSKLTESDDPAPGGSVNNPAGAVGGFGVGAATMRLGGFDLALTVFDSSGVSFAAENYTNSLTFWLEPSFAVGRRFLSGTFFEPLAVSVRVPLEVELAGNDGRFRGRGFASGGLWSAPETLPLLAAQAPSAGTVEGLVRTPLIVGDTWLNVLHGSLWTIPGAGVSVAGGLRVVLPTSAGSRNAGLLTAVSLGTSLGREVGPVHLGYLGRGTQYVFSRAVPEIAPLSDTVTVNGRTEPLWRPGSTTVANPLVGLIHGPSATLTLPKGFSTTLMYLLFHTLPHGLSGCAAPGVPLSDLCADTTAVAGTTRSAWLVDHWFLLSVDWSHGPWALSLGLSTYRPLRTLDGAVSQPFFDASRNNFTTVYLSLSVSAETLVNELLPRKDAQ